MRQSVLAITLGLALTACGSAVAAQPAGGPLVEDRSYDRIEELRATRVTTVGSLSAGDGEFHRLAHAAVPWSRN